MLLGTQSQRPGVVCDTYRKCFCSPKKTNHLKWTHESEMMDGVIQKLLQVAIQAPSGDNTQPWQFRVDERACRLDFLVDKNRDVSPMNAGQRMARISIGAALENLLQVAADSGIRLETVSPNAGSAASLRWEEPWDTEVVPVAPSIGDRVTNRRAFQGRPLDPDVLSALTEKTPPLDGIQTYWITARERIADWARLIGRGDAAMFGEASMRAAFLSKVRFDAAPTEVVDEGLSLASLELSAADRIALRVMRATPHWLLLLGGAPRFFAAHARKLIRSSSGLCVLTAPNDRPETDIGVGRAMQRAWLALTAAGLAAQPMMSLMVLENALRHGSPDLVAQLGRQRLLQFQEASRGLLSESSGDRPAFILRFGDALAPSGRVGRMSLEASLLDSNSPEVG